MQHLYIEISIHGQVKVKLTHSSIKHHSLFKCINKLNSYNNFTIALISSVQKKKHSIDKPGENIDDSDIFDSSQFFFTEMQRQYVMISILII